MLWICFLGVIVVVLHGFEMSCSRLLMQRSCSCQLSMSLNRHGAEYLDKMVKRKKVEVNNLLRRHESADDPLFMRMTYMAQQNHYNVSRALRKLDYGAEKLGKMSIIVDVKRKSPTVPSKRDVVDYRNAGEFCELLAKINVDGFLLNTDETEYGGSLSDLKDASKALKALKLHSKPPLIQKDIIIHPIQIAQALENGASGVLLIMAVVGTDLEALLDACTIMGTEALVEIHTPNELEYALERGATNFLVNMWDRTSGDLFRQQAKYLSSMIPMNCVALAGGDIRSMKHAMELGNVGYDGVVLGRNIIDLPDIKTFVDSVHAFTGPPRAMGMGMKSSSWSANSDSL